MYMSHFCCAKLVANEKTNRKKEQVSLNGQQEIYQFL